MNWLFVISFVAIVAEITSYIENKVTSYFDCGLLKQATDIWLQHVIAYQNTISVAMQESYGFKGMNVYIKRPLNYLLVSRGYYHYDNQVHIVLQDMRLEEFPHISDPVISFPLTSNVIKLEAVVSRIIIHTDYILFRNKSNIVYDLKDQDQYKTSPFLFEQVKNVGQLAITVEGCKLSGISITSLAGDTVSLGNSVFRLLHCRYNFEIFTPGIASPPVVANYLLHDEGLSLDHLLMLPLEAELLPKLQAALHAYVNTSAIFQEMLPEIRLGQDQVFEQTTNYINNVIRNLNVLTITSNAGKILMENFSIYWNDTTEQGEGNSVVTLSNMILTGLETAYSSNTGGPFKLTTIKISEGLRFGTLQVRGSIDLQVGDKTLGMYDFAVEINDVEVDITANIQGPDENNSSRSLHVVEVMGWRSFQFSCPGMAFVSGEALITGYLLRKVPFYLTNYLSNVISDAVNETNMEYKLIEDARPNQMNLNENVNNGQENQGIQSENIPDGQNDITDNIDDGQGDNDPENGINDGDLTISPDRGLNNEAIFSPEGGFNNEEAVISPDGGFNNEKAVISPDGGFNNEGGPIPDDGLNNEEGDLNPNVALNHEGGYLSPDGGVIDVDGDGFVSPSAIIDDKNGVAKSVVNLEDAHGVLELGGSLPDDLNQENVEPADSGNEFELQPNFFDESIFAQAQNQGKK